MTKFLFLMLFLAMTAGVLASELTTVDEPEKVIDEGMTKTLKLTGLSSKFTSEKRVFLRDGVKVAALITKRSTVGDTPTQVTKFIQFYIDADNWLEINLGDPQQFYSRFTKDVIVMASKDSITVTARGKGYFEMFFKSTGAFLAEEERARQAPEFLKEGWVASPR